MKNVGNELKIIRKQRELSLQKLGDMCGRSKAQLHQLEQDNANPTLATAYRVAKVLDCSVYDIWPDTTKIVEETVIVRRVLS